MVTDRASHGPPPLSGATLGLASLIEGAVDPFGYTDRVSNAVAFHGPDPFEMIAGDRAATEDASFLRLFLHEATHHTTFLGPLGHALSALSVSCLAHLDDHRDDETQLPLPVRDLIVNKWLVAALEPLIEGTALFAEYDSVSGSSPIVSFAMRQGIRLVLPQLMEADEKITGGTDDFYTRFSRRLRAARLSPASIEAKANLLSYPLNGPHGYLIGYLATKRLYVDIRRRCPPATDPEFFITGLLSYFCKDETLARIALRATDLDIVKVQLTIGALGEHLQDRLRELYQQTNSIYKAAAESMLRGTGLPDGTFQGALEERIDQLTILSGLRTARLAVSIYWPKLFKHRHVLRFSGRGALVTVIEAGHAEIRREPGGPPLFTCPITKLADRGTYEATIEAICSHAGDVRAIVILGGSGLVAVWNPETGAWNDEALVEELDDFPPMHSVIDAAREVAKAAQDRIATLSGPALEVWRFQEQQATEFSKFLNLQFMLSSFRTEQRNAVHDVLERGFAALFDETEMMNVARLSVAFGGPGCTIAQAAEDLAIGPAVIEGQIERINATTIKKLGFPLMLSEDERVTSVV